MERKLQRNIVRIEEEMQIGSFQTIPIEIKGRIIHKEVHSFTISSLTETEDKRIASGTNATKGGNISIYSYDINAKTWKREIHKVNAHNNYVLSLCTLTGNRLVSGSWFSIKVWAISDTDLIFIKGIDAHTNYVNKIIPLSEHRFASCSDDTTVKIWDDKNYQCQTILQHNDHVISILQLKGKNVLVTCGYFETSFWNINDYTH